MDWKYIFGPVASSRLGRSLGLDLLGAKICSFDCLYCEVGPTRTLTRARKPWVPAATILEELWAWKEANAGLALDYVTLGGMGEPCLNSDMGEILAGARRLFPDKPLAVLTNTSLLSDPEVRRELLAADAVLPSMDSLVEVEFRRLNRPHPAMKLAEIAEGLLAFRREFPGKMYLEVLLGAGLNDSEENLALLKDYVDRLKPDRVDVGTLTRPGTDASVRPVDAAAHARWREALARGATPIRPVATAPRQEHERAARREELAAAVLRSLRRRGQTASQLALALDEDRERVEEALATLLEGRHIRKADMTGEQEGEAFFHAGPLGTDA